MQRRKYREPPSGKNRQPTERKAVMAADEKKRTTPQPAQPRRARQEAPVVNVSTTNPLWWVIVALLVTVGLVIAAMLWHPATNVVVNLPRQAAVVQPTNGNSSSSQGTQSSSTDPSGTVSSNSASSDLSGFMPHEIAAGTSEHLPAGICIEGDVKVNGVAYYDDAASTGLVTCLKQPAKVTAPWGAYASDSSANAQEADLRNSGCGMQGGCKRVKLKFFPPNR